MEKLARDLIRGDVVEIDGGTATITSCRRSALIEAAAGPAWEIEYRDDQTGESGRHIVIGQATVIIAGKQDG